MRNRLRIFVISDRIREMQEEVERMRLELAEDIKVSGEKQKHRRKVHQLGQGLVLDRD